MSHDGDEHETKCIGCMLTRMINEQYPEGKSSENDAKKELSSLANAAAYFTARHPSLTIPFLALFAQQTYNNQFIYAQYDAIEMDRKASTSAPVSIVIN